MVTLPAGMTADNVPLLKVLELLDGPFKEVAEGFADGRYVLWLGSGISRAKVDDLGKVCNRVVKHIWKECIAEGGTGPFSNALDKILALADVTGAEKALMDLGQPPNTWPNIGEIIGRLTRKYSNLLGIVIQGKDADYLLWEVVDVPGTYANDGIEPDCEHLCVAILALEGLVGDIASANWDGLIEKAIAQLSGGASNILSVCVTKEDFGSQVARTRLLKFHGCAVRAKNDAAKYREYLVGRASQIVTWGKNDGYQLMRHELVGLASKCPSLVIGLSVQDFNIKTVFADGDQLNPHAYPSHPPAYVFAEQDLGVDQEVLLQAVYGADKYAENEADIIETARIPARAKPLLTALVLSVLSIKMATYAKRATAPSFDAADWNKLVYGIVQLRNRVAKQGDGDRSVFIKSLIAQMSRLLSAFRGLRCPSDDRLVGLGMQGAKHIEVDPNIGVTGLAELANIAGMLGCIANDDWTMRVEATGALEVEEAGKKRRIFVVSSSDAAAGLVADGRIDENDSDTIVAICTAVSPRRTRSPSLAPGRVMNPGTATDVAVRAILATAVGADEAVQLFREQAGL